MMSDRRGVNRRGLLVLGLGGGAVGLLAPSMLQAATPVIELLPEAPTKGLLIWDPTPGGYVAEEYLMRGTADVLKPVASVDTQDSATRDYTADMARREFTRERVAAAQPYCARLVVFRPLDRARQSGNVIVETAHPQGGGNPGVWSEISPFFMGNGDVYVSVQHPVALPAMKAADPARYGAVAAADPTQLWGMLADVGRLIRAGGATSPVGGPPIRRIYMTGYSYTGQGCAVFANYHHNETRMPGGRPVYDGYVTMGNAMFNRPLDVPVIRLNTEADYANWGGLNNRRPDSDARIGRYRHYELAGSAHSTTPWPQAGASRRPARGLPVAQGQPVYNANTCYAAFPSDSKPNDYPRRIPIAAVFSNLYAWVDKGTAPPRVARIEVDAQGQTRHDAFGNAVGGVRLPQVAAPIASYGMGHGRDCQLFGYTQPFDLARRRTLYGSRDAYVAKVEQISRDLVAQRLILPAGASDLVAWAKRSDAF